MHYMALQHPQALYGTLDNSSILASQCLECFQMFVAMMTWGLPFRIKRSHGWIAEKNLVMLPYCKLSKNVVKLQEHCKHDQIPDVHRSNHSKWKKWSCCIMHIYRGLIGHMIWNGDQATYLLKLEGLYKRKPKTIFDSSLVFQGHSFLIFKNGFGNCLGCMQQLDGVTTQLTRSLCSLCIYGLSC